MNNALRGRLGARGSTLTWLFQPVGEVNEAGRAFLLGQLLSAPLAAIMGAFCSLIVITVAVLRTGDNVYALFFGLEGALTIWRLADGYRRRRLGRLVASHVPTIDMPALLSTLWCMLQGALAFTTMSSDDSILRTLSATLVMALVGPLCARHYAAPRFAFLLVLLCDLPFVAGALASGDPWLAVILPMTPPFLLGSMQIIMTFHRAMISTLAAEAENLHLAQHDWLTGIMNRQGMDQALSRLIPARDRTIALISLDLDGFKEVNDRYGHDAGDSVLAEAAGRIRSTLRPDDLLARMGGDEFMAVIFDQPPDEIGPLADRLIAALSSRPYDVDGCIAVQVGASIGFACLPQDAAGTIELRLCADQALYAAKVAGKGVGRRFRAGASGSTTPLCMTRIRVKA